MRAVLLAPILLVLLAGCSVPEQAFEREMSDEVGKPFVGDLAWGTWAAEAGATNVTGAIYLPIHGASPVRVRFVQPEFRGVDDPTWSVPIRDNLVMGWGPTRDEFEWGTGPSVVLPLGPDRTEAVVNYRILRVPEILPAQPYRADYAIDSVSPS